MSLILDISEMNVAAASGDEKRVEMANCHRVNLTFLRLLSHRSFRTALKRFGSLRVASGFVGKGNSSRIRIAV